MIFVTVGSMLPFDRFVKAVDAWAGRNPDRQAFIQIGGGAYEPGNVAFSRMLTPTEFDRRVAESELIIAHAGMGSVILAAQASKPIVLFPRRMALGEHTTDHQLHTVGWLKERPGIFVAMDETELDRRIEEAGERQSPGAAMASAAPPEFVARLRSAIIR